MKSLRVFFPSEQESHIPINVVVKQLRNKLPVQNFEAFTTGISNQSSLPNLITEFLCYN